MKTRDQKETIDNYGTNLYGFNYVVTTQDAYYCAPLLTYMEPLWDTGNTATFRILARHHEERQQYEMAANMYERAAMVYPTKTGELAAADIAGLLKSARECRADAAVPI